SKDLCMKIVQKLNNRYVDKDHNSILAQMVTFYKQHNDLTDDFLEKLNNKEKEIFQKIRNTRELGFADIYELDIDEKIAPIYEYYVNIKYNENYLEFASNTNDPNIIQDVKLKKIPELKKKSIKFKRKKERIL